MNNSQIKIQANQEAAHSLAVQSKGDQDCMALFALTEYWQRHDCQIQLDTSFSVNKIAYSKTAQEPVMSAGSVGTHTTLHRARPKLPYLSPQMGAKVQTTKLPEVPNSCDQVLTRKRTAPWPTPARSGGKTRAKVVPREGNQRQSAMFALAKSGGNDLKI